MNHPIKIMKLYSYFPPIALFFCSIILSYCSSDEEEEFSLVGTNTSIAKIAGNWNATKGLFQSSTPGPAFDVDVVIQGGTITMQIQTSGQFSITVTEAGGIPDTSTGRMAFDEDLLVIFFDDDPGEFEFFGIQHNEPNLIIQGGNGSAEFDFDGDGNEDPANIDFEFVRI